VYLRLGGTKRVAVEPIKSTTSLVRVVAANWSLGTQLKVPQPDHPYTFFSAKIAATFMQLNASALTAPVVASCLAYDCATDALLADDRANAIGCAISSNLCAPF
jgi:hypothetical protein